MSDELAQLQARLCLCELSREGAMQDRERLRDALHGLLCLLAAHYESKTLRLLEDPLGLHFLTWETACAALTGRTVEEYRAASKRQAIAEAPQVAVTILSRELTEEEALRIGETRVRAAKEYEAEPRAAIVSDVRALLSLLELKASLVTPPGPLEPLTPPSPTPEPEGSSDDPSNS